MANARFSEEQLQDILAKLKITLHGRIRECKALTSNIGMLIKIASYERSLKDPDSVSGDTVHKLNTYQLMLNEVNAFLRQLTELAARTPMAA